MNMDLNSYEFLKENGSKNNLNLEKEDEDDSDDYYYDSAWDDIQIKSHYDYINDIDGESYKY